jgi:hypothetical protein
MIPMVILGSEKLGKKGLKAVVFFSDFKLYE